MWIYVTTLQCHWHDLRAECSKTQAISCHGMFECCDTHDLLEGYRTPKAMSYANLQNYYGQISASTTLNELPLGMSLVKSRYGSHANRQSKTS